MPVTSVPSSPAPPTIGPVRRELRITARLLADNIVISALPPLAFTVVAALRYGLGGVALAGSVLGSLLWSVLFIYVVDASNQAAAAHEDRINKPYRPIPAGLVTETGMWRRAVAGSVLYLVIAACCGWIPLLCAAIWTASITLFHRRVAQRHYLYVKPWIMVLGVCAQLAGGWSIAHPLDGTGWRWVLGCALLFVLPLPIEDIRDIEGDRAIGRRTLALVLGARPVRAWFIVMMLAWPVLAWLLLFRDSGAAPAVIAVITAVFTALCWGTAAHAALHRGRRGDRIDYQLYSVAQLALVASALVLLT
ncbi:UbiA family prenyltransferase [Sciscionella sediminilitoris]|uniref:UbiA family prenyltransferase n=1 Tax=Sciscionella sediminilitoris TaxID=1445613 RepID=UPI0012E0D566|nr:UbiA family prenyltransferase [Sciscionella sp. SE31]